MGVQSCGNLVEGGGSTPDMLPHGMPPPTQRQRSRGELGTPPDGCVVEGRQLQGGADGAGVHDGKAHPPIISH